MKKNIYSRLFKLGIIFASIYTALFGYVIHANQIVTIEKESAYQYHEVSVVQEEVVEETVEEAVVEEAVSNESFSINTSYQEPYVIPGNSIRIGNVLYDHLMKDDGSNYYLNHNLSGVYDGRGVPFIDVRNDFTGRKTIIYSHSIMGGYGPFQALQNYHNNPSYYYNNPYITIEYEGNTYTYQIFSVYVSVANSEQDEGLEYFREMTYRDDEWEEMIQTYKSRSEYDTGVSVSGSDKILILQTCSMDPQYYEQYYRYNLLVMGKLI